MRRVHLDPAARYDLVLQCKAKEDLPVTHDIVARLRKAGLSLPPAAAAAGNYVPWTRAGGTVYISGQLPLQDGKLLHTGRLGDGVSLEEGQAAARACALNILAQLQAALDGDLGRVRQCLKLGGFVASTSGFHDHPKVVNGASDLMVLALGENGRHARFAVGVASLPMNAAVEIDATFEVDL
ncbi:MAG: RidA family protein [Geminicoccaceae bacterium]|nr:RidA family protein [Geminicoccaceae bacterium]MCB9945658.1 RidA family protein [Geminicoccaceae bacterium]